MNEFIRGLEISVTSGSLWESVLPIVTFVGSIIIFAFGIHAIHEAYIDWDIVHNGRLNRKPIK